MGNRVWFPIFPTQPFVKEKWQDHFWMEIGRGYEYEEKQKT